MTQKPDWQRMIDLFESEPDRYFATFEIAKMLNIQSNTVQARLWTLKDKGYSILNRPHQKGSKVLCYQLAKPEPEHGRQPHPAREWAWVQVERACPKCGSFYRRGTKCNICGEMC